VVADVAKLAVGREDYYLRELATDHEQYLSGHGESPGRWYGAGAATLGLEGEASSAGFRRVFEGRHHPDTGELLGRPQARARCRPSTWSCAPPRASPSSMAWATQRPAGPSLRPITPVSARHLGTRRGHGGHQHVDGQGLLAVGFDHRTSREGDPLLHTTWSSPTACRGRTAAERPWTAVTCIGTA
jgi:hypothetical protein